MSTTSMSDVALVFLLFIINVEAKKTKIAPYGILMCNRDCCAQKGCQFVTYSVDHTECKLGADNIVARKPKKCTCFPDVKGCVSDCDQGGICLLRHTGSYTCVDRSIRSLATSGPALAPTTDADKINHTAENKSDIELPIEGNQTTKFKYLTLKFENVSVESGCRISAFGVLTSGYPVASQPFCAAYADRKFLPSQIPQIFNLKVVVPPPYANKGIMIVSLLFCPKKHKNRDTRQCSGFVLKKMKRRTKVNCWTKPSRPDDLITGSVIRMKKEWNFVVMFIPQAYGTTTIALFDADSAVLYVKTHLIFSSKVFLQVVIDNPVSGNKYSANFEKVNLEVFQILGMLRTLRLCTERAKATKIHLKQAIVG